MKHWFWLLPLLAGCAAAPSRVETYSLDVDSRPPLLQKLPLALAVSEPGARAGYDSALMAYQTSPHHIEYFANNQWVAPPNKMLLPLLLTGLDRRFQTVARAPAPFDGQLRLDGILLSLRQEFENGNSRVHLEYRAQLYDLKKRNVIATREYDLFEDASPDPYGGVKAANRVVAKLVELLGEFCEQGAKSAIH